MKWPLFCKIEYIFGIFQVDNAGVEVKIPYSLGN